MVKEDILNLCEGRFEKMIQMGNEGKKNDEALHKYSQNHLKEETIKLI